MADHEEHPAVAIAQYLAYLEAEGYREGVITFSRRGVIRFARFLVGRPAAFGAWNLEHWQPYDRILRVRPEEEPGPRRAAEVEVRAALGAYVLRLEDQGYSPATIADFRLEAVWFVLWLLGRPLMFGQSVPTRWQADD